MAANPYAKAPLCVAEVDPATGRHTRAFFFLGAAPPGVLEAARRRRGDPRRPEWAAADAAALRAYYGPRWRDLLTAEDPPEPEALGTGAAARIARTFFVGGDVGDIGGDGGDVFSSLADLDDVAAAPGAAPAAEDRGPEDDWRRAAGAAPAYTDLAAYPEDTVYDLRLKLSLASGVPLYRQHLFYYLNDEGPIWPHAVTVDGAPVALDWRALAPALGRDEATAAVAGVPVDPRLEERREGLRVEARDTFAALAPGPGVRVTRAYFVDLYAVLPPLAAAGRPQDGLAAALRDRYQFDLLYYGGLLKYWPQLSPDACALALEGPRRLREAYPALDPAPAALRARFEAEREVADAALRWRPAAAPGGRAPVAVTAATLRVEPEAARMKVSVRNVFDWVPTSPAVAAAVARFDVDTALFTEAGAALAGPAARQGGVVPVVAVKRHASSYGPRTAVAVDGFAGRLPRRDTVAFALAREAADDDRAQAGRRIPFVILTVHGDGRYEASADWREDDRASFEQAAAEVGAVVGPTVAAVNAMGAAAFPVGGRPAAAAARSAAARSARRGS